MESVVAKVPSAALRTGRTSSGISKKAAGLTWPLILFPQARLSPWPACSLPQINTKRMSAFKGLRHPGILCMWTHTSRTLPAPLIQVRAWLALTLLLCPALRVRHVGSRSSRGRPQWAYPDAPLHSHLLHILQQLPRDRVYRQRPGHRCGHCPGWAYWNRCVYTEKGERV